jgi:enterochelin esterase-like enzyme
VTGEDGITRRQFVVGGGALAALVAAAGVVGWRSWRVRNLWYELSGAYGEPGAFPSHYAVRYVYDTMPSKVLGRDVSYGVAWPPGHELPGRGLPLCFCLPGRGRGPRQVLEGTMRLGDFAAAPIVAGTASPFALVSVDGGNTYWHRRASGEDAMAMLLEEFIPFAESRFGGARTAGRKAVMGWSMGGYGALHAAELRPDEFTGVSAASPALWRSYADGVGDAFDSAADYAGNDVYAGADRLAGLDVRIDCGKQDPFYAADKAFVEALPSKPMGEFSAGGHNDGFWRKVAPAEIDFVWRSLYSRLESG